MPNLNRCHFIGNLTRDPELRVTPNGTPICSFSLAINRTWQTEDGEKQEEVTFLNFEAWGKAGETIAKYCTKGRPLYVGARAKQDSWEDKNTKEKRTAIKFVVEEFQFLGDGRGKPEGGASEEPAGRTTTTMNKPAAQEVAEEDRPF